ncbi:MAG TPA: RHS repeat domain-containing protein [Clostridia bacterium]
MKTLYNKKGSTVLSSYEYTYYLNGKQASKTDTTGITTYAYDGLGRLVTVSEPGSVTTAYQYDDYNNRNKMVVTGGTSPCAITYGYDSLNRLKTDINSVSGTQTTVTMITATRFQKIMIHISMMRLTK